MGARIILGQKGALAEVLMSNDSATAAGRPRAAILQMTCDLPLAAAFTQTPLRRQSTTTVSLLRDVACTCYHDLQPRIEASRSSIG